MKIFHSDAYSLPIVGSVLTHAVLVGALMVGSLSLFSSDPISTNTAQPPAIQAVAVTDEQLNKELDRLRQREADEAAAQQALLDQAEAARQARIREEQQLAELRRQQEEAAVQEQARQEQARQAEQARLAEIEQRAAEEQAQLERIQQQRAEEEAARQAQQREAERARQAELEQQRRAEEAAEQARLEAARTSVIQSEVQRYGQLVQQKVARSWAIQGSVSQGAYTTLNVRLSTNGTVLNVQVVQSSGNNVLDRSAEAAVYKASPLPVPEDPEALEQFRELRLTLRPDEILTQR